MKAELFEVMSESTVHHCNVAAGFAQMLVRRISKHFEKIPISLVDNVNLRKIHFRIYVDVSLTINTTQHLSHRWSTFLTVLAIEDWHSPLNFGSTIKIRRIEDLFAISCIENIYSALYMTTVKLVRITTID